jgi:hypothetical protein
MAGLANNPLCEQTLFTEISALIEQARGMAVS